MHERLDQLHVTARDELAEATTDAAVEAWRVLYLGRRSELTKVLRSIRDLPVKDRQSAGQTANSVRKSLQIAYDEKIARQHQAPTGDDIDTTMPGYPMRIGSLHPLTQTLRSIRQIFAPLGFRAVSGPEVEWDRYNFELLNIPADHPARDMWDTFHIRDDERPGEILLRTHTSPVQARIMEQVSPPVRMIVPGKVYRYEDRDASHEAELMQVEGLAIDEHITMADLRGTLAHFIRAMFGADRDHRLRASYFPFTEPSVEVDVSCHVCEGTGCSLCSNSGWIEILGAGMVHPTVLINVGYDPEQYQGFAFGMGVERITMVKLGVTDIRDFYRNDLRFLRQFR